MDYFRFYQFKEDPFGFTPDPDFFYPSKSHLLALESMQHFLKKGEGLMLISGGPGTGKTTLIRTLLRNQPNDILPIVMYNSAIRPEDLLLALVERLGNLTEKFETRGKIGLLDTLTTLLLKGRAKGFKHILILDEAQDLPEETLNEIKLLSNIETDKEKLLNIILLSQLFFEDTLSKPNYAQINQRITLRVRLSPLDFNGTQEYIKFRLQKAGSAPILFERGAMKMIYKASKGIPRLINLICSRTLMVGYLKSSYKISKSFVELALKHLHL